MSDEIKQDLSDRMKGYESSSRHYLRVGLGELIIIRVDGRAFHTYTRGAKTPFDDFLHASMNETGKALCNEVQGARLAYIQSDEISIVLSPGAKQDIWFDGNIQKMCSISAAVASVVMTRESPRVFGATKEAQFDSRVFALPREEVVNYLIWRQSDATRNSVQMLARSLFSHRELVVKGCDEMKQMCRDKGRPWEDEPVGATRGRCVVRSYAQEKVEFVHKRSGETRSTLATRTRWVPDWDIPLFVTNKGYVERHLDKEEE